MLDDPVLEEISKEVDSLVNDERQFGDVYLDAFNGKVPQTRPPGLFLSHAHPSSTLEEQMTIERQQRSPTVSQVIAPAIPVIPAVPAVLASPGKVQGQVLRQNVSSISMPDAQKSLKSGAAKEKAKTFTPLASAFPPLAAPSVPVKIATKAEPSKTSAKTDTKDPASVSQNKTGKSETSKSSDKASKRPVPPPVKTSALTGTISKKAEKAAAKAESSAKSAALSTAAQSPIVSHPSTPITQAPDSPATRPPKMLRLTSGAFKTEIVASAGIGFSAGGTAPPAVTKQAQRQALVSSTNRPGTPTSELISDTVSMTSASLSRANSPPPSVVGAAPVKAKTKNQLKKERREAQREKERREQEEVVVKTPVDEVQQAPILGRLKKKVRLPGTEGSTPVPSRPASPTLKEEEAKIVASPPLPVPVLKELKREKEKDRETKKEKIKEKERVVEEKKVTPEPVAPAIFPTESAQKRAHTAASFLAELQAKDPFYKDLAFFKSIIGLNSRQEFTAEDFQSLNRKPQISEQDQRKLSEGKPVQISGPNDRISSRILISPGGCFLRGLTPEQEERYLILEKRVTEEKGLGKWITTRAGGENGFSMIQDRVGQTGPTAVGTDPAANGGSSSALNEAQNKLRVGDALGYINQFVLRALPANRSKSKEIHGYEFSDFNRKVAGNVNETGQDLNPSRYTPYMPGSTAAFGSDVAGVMHGMASDGTDGGSSSAEGVVRKPTQLPCVPLLSESEAEKALLAARKETEGLERRIGAIFKKNKRLAFSSAN